MVRHTYYYTGDIKKFKPVNHPMDIFGKITRIRDSKIDTIPWNCIV